MMTSSQHVYEVRPRKDKRGVDLIFDAAAIRSARGRGAAGTGVVFPPFRRGQSYKSDLRGGRFQS